MPDRPDLEQLMRAAAAGERPEAEFLAALHAGEVVLPQQPGSTGLVPGEPVDLPVVEVRGRRAVPVFTSAERFTAVVPDAPHVTIAVRSLQRMLPAGLGLVVNPYGELTRLLAPAEVAALPAALAIVPSEPATETPAVLAAVADFARAQRGRVVAAHRALLTPPQDAQPVLAVGLVPAPGTAPDDLLAAAERELAPADVPPFSLLVLEPDAPGPVERFMLERTEPFWTAPPET